MSYSHRRDAATTNVTAGRPTLRRTAARQTHATQHGRQRPRSRYRPTDSLQLSWLTHVGSISLTCRPRRLPSKQLVQLTRSQHAVSVRLLFSTANFRQFALPTPTKRVSRTISHHSMNYFRESRANRVELILPDYSSSHAVTNIRRPQVAPKKPLSQDSRQPQQVCLERSTRDTCTGKIRPIQRVTSATTP